MFITQAQYSDSRGWQPPLPVNLDDPRTLVVAFGAPALLQAPQPLAELAAAFGRSAVVGCSSSGEIAGERIGDGGISVAIARFSHTDLVVTRATVADAADSGDAGRRLAAALPAAGLRAVFLLSPGVDVNGDALVRALRAGLPEGVHLSGGLAGDGADFERTWVLCGPRAEERQVVAVGLYGDALRLGLGCRGGWKPFGPERRVTRSEGHVLHELDGQPALQLYRRYLGEMADQLPGAALRFPLSLRVGSSPGTVVRTVLGIDEDRQSLTFGGDMPAGATVSLMRSTLDHLVASAEEATDEALHALFAQSLPPAAPVLALTVSCIGRRLVMGERTEEEVAAVVERLPAGSVHAGFYSYGEVAPGSAGGCADLHNQTLTLTLLAEAAAP